ncbi:MAG: preprotein translocase subunit SecG [Deltaproteobacteria bacterium]|nr:preprotein translocase subunit SecG [Deltaproteobacteria bacterium]
MHTFMIIVHVLICVFLVGAVLLQSGKGASMGSSFGGSSGNALFGSSGPTTLLTKATALCAAVFMLTSLYLTYISSGPSTHSIMSDIPSVKESPVATPGTTEAKPETKTEPDAGSSETTTK